MPSKKNTRPLSNPITAKTRSNLAVDGRPKLRKELRVLGQLAKEVEKYSAMLVRFLSLGKDSRPEIVLLLPEPKGLKLSETKISELKHEVIQFFLIAARQIPVKQANQFRIQVLLVPRTKLMEEAGRFAAISETGLVSPVGAPVAEAGAKKTGGKIDDQFSKLRQSLELKLGSLPSSLTTASTTVELYVENCLYTAMHTAETIMYEQSKHQRLASLQHYTTEAMLRLMQIQWL